MIYKSFYIHHHFFLSLYYRFYSKLYRYCEINNWIWTTISQRPVLWFFVYLPQSKSWYLNIDVVGYEDSYILTAKWCNSALLFARRNCCKNPHTHNRQMCHIALLFLWYLGNSHWNLSVVNYLRNKYKFVVTQFGIHNMATMFDFLL